MHGKENSKTVCATYSDVKTKVITHLVFNWFYWLVAPFSSIAKSFIHKHRHGCVQYRIKVYWVRWTAIAIGMKVILHTSITIQHLFCSALGRSCGRILGQYSTPVCADGLRCDTATLVCVANEHQSQQQNVVAGKCSPMSPYSSFSQ